MAEAAGNDTLLDLPAPAWLLIRHNLHDRDNNHPAWRVGSLLLLRARRRR